MFFSLTLQLYAAIEDVIQYPTEFQKSHKFLTATALKGNIHNVVTVGRVYKTTVTEELNVYVTSIMGFNKSGKYVYFAHSMHQTHILLYYNHPPCRIAAKTITFEYEDSNNSLTGTREIVIPQFLDECE